MSLLPSKPDTSAATSDAEPRVIGVDSDDAEDVIAALSSETARKLLTELHEEPAPPSELAERVDTSLQNAQYHLQKLESAGAVSVVDTAYSAKGREMDVYAPADQPLVIFAGDEEKTTGLKAALSRLIGGLGVLAVGSLIVQKLYGDARENGGAVAPAGSSGGPKTAPTTVANGGQGGVVETVTKSGAHRGAENVTRVADTYAGNNMTLDNVGTTHAPMATETSGHAAGNASTVAETAAHTATTTHAATNATVTHTTTAAETAARATAGIEPGLLFFAGGLVILALWLAVWYVRNQ